MTEEERTGKEWEEGGRARSEVGRRMRKEDGGGEGQEGGRKEGARSEGGRKGRGKEGGGEGGGGR